VEFSDEVCRHKFFQNIPANNSEREQTLKEIGGEIRQKNCCLKPRIEITSPTFSFDLAK
jgi:uncharacterized protein YdhG (YjbR/CyaY superfamily)